jgi:hypothetical protein
MLLLDLMCVAGVGWCAVLLAGLLGGAMPLPTSLAAAVAAGLVLPGFTAGVIGNRRVVRGRQPQSGSVRSVWSPPVGLPQRWIVASGVLFLAFWLTGLSALAGLDEDVPAGDAAALHRQAVAQQRFALGVLGGIGIGGTTLAAASLLRTRQRPVAGARPASAG